MSTVGDLAKVLDQLGAAEAAEIERHLRAPAVNALRLWRRDEAFRRAARRLFPDVDDAAGPLDEALARYATTGWLRDQHLNKLPNDANERRALLFAILRESDGVVIGRKQISNVLAGRRKR
jgi:hypothetical protein